VAANPNTSLAFTGVVCTCYVQEVSVFYLLDFTIYTRDVNSDVREGADDQPDDRSSHGKVKYQLSTFHDGKNTLRDVNEFKSSIIDYMIILRRVTYCLIFPDFRVFILFGTKGAKSGKQVILNIVTVINIYIYVCFTAIGGRRPLTVSINTFEKRSL